MATRTQSQAGRKTTLKENKKLPPRAASRPQTSKPDVRTATTRTKAVHADVFELGRLVPVHDGKIGTWRGPVVDARDVHVFLAARRNFPTWFAVQIGRFKLVKTVDFAPNAYDSGQNLADQKVVVTQHVAGRPAVWGIANEEGFAPTGAKPRGGRPRLGYILTIGTARRIVATIAGPRGQALRDYLLEQERRMSVGKPPLPGSLTIDEDAPVPMELAKRVKGRGSRMKAMSDAHLHRLEDYLRVAGLHDRHIAGATKHYEEDVVLEAEMHPFGWTHDTLTGRPVFSRAVLDAWWDVRSDEVLRVNGFQSYWFGDRPLLGPS